VTTEAIECLGTVLDAAKPSTPMEQPREKYEKQPVEPTNPSRPPNPSGKRAPIPSDMALLFVRLPRDSRKRMARGRPMVTKML